MDTLKNDKDYVEAVKKEQVAALSRCEVDWQKMRAMFGAQFALLVGTSFIAEALAVATGNPSDLAGVPVAFGVFQQTSKENENERSKKREEISGIQNDIQSEEGNTKKAIEELKTAKHYFEELKEAKH